MCFRTKKTADEQAQEQKNQEIEKQLKQDLKVCVRSTALLDLFALIL
jgi:hypothetical protein